MLITESSTLLDEMAMPIGLSTRSRQVVMEGGHDLQEEIPDQVAGRDPRGTARALGHPGDAVGHDMTIDRSWPILD